MTNTHTKEQFNQAFETIAASATLMAEARAWLWEDMGRTEWCNRGDAKYLCILLNRYYDGGTPTFVSACAELLEDEAEYVAWAEWCERVQPWLEDGTDSVYSWAVQS